MNGLLGWTLRIFGAFLWIFMVVMFKNENPGWVSDVARFWFYTLTSLGGLACFLGAGAILGNKSKDSVGIDIGVDVIVPLNHDDN